MAVVGHLWFFLLSHLLRNYLTDSNETCLLCSPQCLVVQVQTKILVLRQIWPFGSRFGLSEISHWQSFYRISSKTTGRIFFEILVRMFPSMSSCASTKIKSNLSKNMATAAIFDFSCYRISSGTTWRIRMKHAYCVHLSAQLCKYRQKFRSFDRFGRLAPGSDLVKFPIDSLVIAYPPKQLVGFFLDLGQNVPLNV